MWLHSDATGDGKPVHWLARLLEGPEVTVWRSCVCGGRNRKPDTLFDFLGQGEAAARWSCNGKPRPKRNRPRGTIETAFEITVMTQRWFTGAVVGAAMIAAPLAAPEATDRLADRKIPDDCYCWIGLAQPRALDAVLQIARATRTPLGVEALPSTTPPMRFDLNQDRKWLAGMTIGDALDIIVALDPRYAWSETQGTIVVRPLLAWNDAEHFLEQSVGPFSLDEEVSVDVAFGEIRRFMGQAPGGGSPLGPFDDKRIKLTLPRASLLDVLNAIVSAHGEIYWSIRYCWPTYSLARPGACAVAWPLLRPFPRPVAQPDTPHEVWFDLHYRGYESRGSGATFKVPNPVRLDGAVLEAPYMPGRKRGSRSLQ